MEGALRSVKSFAIKLVAGCLYHGWDGGRQKTNSGLTQHGPETRAEGDNRHIEFECVLRYGQSL
jgi:hypothetical protein